MTHGKVKHMNKQLLIITSKIEKTASWPDRERYVQEFVDALSHKTTDVKVTYTTYQDLIFSVINGKLTIFDTRNNLDLKQVGLVHFKNWTFEYEEAALIAFYLKQNGIGFYNAEVGVKAATGKIAQMFYLAAEGVPVPDSFFAHRGYFKDLFSQGRLPEGFSLPFIFKADNGSRGDDNHLIHSFDHALDVLSDESETEFILQSFIPNDGDFRCLFVGTNSKPLLFRRTAQSGSHLNNTSKGGSGELVEFSSLPKDYLRFARRASEVLGREIGGVDIIVDKKTNQPYILEVNGTPALATGYATNEKIDLFAEFLHGYFDGQEEE